MVQPLPGNHPGEGISSSFLTAEKSEKIAPFLLYNIERECYSYTTQSNNLYNQNTHMNNNTDSADVRDIAAKLESLTPYQKLVVGCCIAAPVIGVIGGIVSIAKEIIEVVKK